MLNITGLNRFFFVRDFHDMRCKYDKVLSIIHQQLNRDPEDGDVFIVMSKDLRLVRPTLGNEFIALVKETSVVSFVGAADLYVAFNYIGTNSYEFMVPYLVMALIYIVIVLLISLGIKLMERSLKKSDRRN